jgi:hypothetical protein
MYEENVYSKEVLDNAPEKIKESVRSNKYTIGVVEVNYLKKLIKEKCSEYEYVTKVTSSKDGDWVNFEIHMSPEAIDYIKSALRYLDGGNLTLFLKESAQDLMRECNALSNALNVTYDERDLMTDYHGSYRYHAHCNREIEGNNDLYNALKKAFERLKEENEERGDTGVYHDKLHKLLHMNGIEVERL